MLSRIQKHFFLAFTSYLAISLTFFQFLTIYKFDQKIIGFVSVGILSLTALLIPFKRIRYFAYFFSYLVALYILIPMSEAAFFPWIETFYLKLLQVSQMFMRGQTDFLPHEMAVVLLLLVILVLIELLVEFKQVGLTVLFLVSYLLLLAVYNQENFSLPLLIVLSIGLLQKIYLMNQRKQGEVQSYFPFILLLVTFSVTFLYFPRENVEQSILSQTSRFRSFLNERGVYHFIQQQGIPQLARTGFSENDEQLGGPIFDDNQIVFEAIQTNPHYWRVESKSFYTGNGWQKSPKERTAIKQASNQFMYTTYEGNQSLKPSEDITLHLGYNETYVPLPYGVIEGQIETAKEINFFQAMDSNRIDAEESMTGLSLEMQWQNFDYRLVDLTAVPLINPSGPVDYLQLPEDLPELIPNLATSLVAKEETLLGKVIAIEKYLKEDDSFRYSKVDATHPEKNQDFVAHFLFESQVGYCDHFSSAMTVLLRSIGIPARWVKGFAPGDLLKQEGEKMRYVIRNNDAHSWVEVYFEGYGWLPFEPTPSFSQSVQEEVETLETTNVSSETSQQSSEVVQRSSTIETGSVEETTESTRFTPTLVNKSDESPFSAILSKLFLGIMLLLLLFAVFYFYKWRVYIVTILLLYLKKEPFAELYRFILKQFEQHYERSSEQTLLEYAYVVENDLPNLNHSFSELTKIYEAYLYDRGVIITSHHYQKLKFIAKQMSHLK